MPSFLEDFLQKFPQESPQEFFYKSLKILLQKLVHYLSIHHVFFQALVQKFLKNKIKKKCLNFIRSSSRISNKSCFSHSYSSLSNFLLNSYRSFSALQDAPVVKSTTPPKDLAHSIRGAVFVSTGCVFWKGKVFFRRSNFFIIVYANIPPAVFSEIFKYSRKSLKYLSRIFYKDSFRFFFPTITPNTTSTIS